MKTKHYVYGVDTVNGYDAWALFEAAALGDVPKAKTLLAKDARLVNAQFWYQFPIHLAVYAGRAEIVKLLLDHGADPGQSIYTYNSWNKLLACARDRGDRPVGTLLQRAMHKRFHYTPDFEPLKVAIVARDSRKIGAILRRQPELAQASDALGNNPLHWSVLTRQLDLVERFVKQGTPIGALRADGLSPVLLAVSGATDYWYRETRGRSHPSLRNHFVIVGSLLAHGADYSLSVAAAVGDQQRVEELLLADAGLARRLDSARISPLSYSAREGHLHIVRLLLERGANPKAPEDGAPRGRALYEACVQNHVDIARLLLEHGADPDAGVDSCECCLTICKTYHGDRAKPLQQLLRQHGASTPPYAMNARELKQAIRDNDPIVRHEEFCGNVLRSHNRELLDLYLDSDPTALDQLDLNTVVTDPKSPSLVKNLLARGLDPNRTDWLGKTFLHACAETGNQPVAALLLDAGADINARDVEFHGTPLAAAVRACCTASEPQQAKRARQMVEVFLQRGAKTHLPGDKPWSTPLAWANCHDRHDLVELLHGAT